MRKALLVLVLAALAAGCVPIDLGGLPGGSGKPVPVTIPVITDPALFYAR